MNIGTLKNAALLIITLSALAGCKAQADYIQFDDKISMHQYTDTYGVCMGAKGYYFVYGSFPVADHTFGAGECTIPTPPYMAMFKIKDLVTQNPDCDDPRVEQEIAKQEGK